MGSYDKAKTRLVTECGIARTKLRMAGADLVFDEIMNAYKGYKAVVDYTASMVLNALDFSKEKVEDVSALAYKSAPKIIGAGLTVNTDPSAIVGAVSEGARGAASTMLGAAIYGAKATQLAHTLAGSLLEIAFKGVKDGFDYYNAEVSSWERLKSAIDNVSSAANNLQTAYAALAAAEQAYRAKIAEGDTIREELAMQRRHWANDATGIRYADMYDRIQRNNALTKPWSYPKHFFV
jgi:2-methylisocitrate lyase-like PEP mutase family enzyme